MAGITMLSVVLLAGNTLATPILRGPAMPHLSNGAAHGKMLVRSHDFQTAVIDEHDNIIRAVDQLDEAAAEEAHRRDETASRAFSDIKITTSDGKCLSVDKLSGDFRANLNPVDVVDCDTTDGEGWDIITSGAHNDREGTMLVVSSLTQACLNFDPRREAGDQVNLFSCGGRADGGGEVTDSQLFMFEEGAASMALRPVNGQRLQCLTSSGERVDITACEDGATDQVFSLGGALDGGNDEDDEENCEDEDEEEDAPAPTRGA